MKNHKWKTKTNRSLCMNTREIAKEYRLSHWVEKMRERQESGSRHGCSPVHLPAPLCIP